MTLDANDEKLMRLALELAVRGEGFVEPNPMVGCVLAKGGDVIGQGWHEKFGGPHAEINALRDAGDDAKDSTAYVSLEPCCHHGKTPPCTDALINAGVSRVIVAMSDPFEKVSGAGIKVLRAAGIDVNVGSMSQLAEQINAPFTKRVTTGIPWIIAKWAMTWDGKIATQRGDSQWISNSESRRIAHQIRGRVDGIMVGSGTALTDDPMLNARPPGARPATRIVTDSAAQISLDSKLVKTAHEYPVLIAVGPNAAPDKIISLKAAGCEIWQGCSSDRRRRLLDFLKHLGEKEMTNVLVEGGGKLLGGLRQLQMIDEVHMFLGPKLFGGAAAPSPVGAPGVDWVADANSLTLQSVRQLDDDVYVIGRVQHQE